MKFSELREEFEGYEHICREAKDRKLPIPVFQTETRQRINLSSHAYSILVNDLDVFHHQLNVTPGSSKMGSEMINHVFRAFRQDADASIYHSCERQRRLLEETLKDLDPQTRAIVIPTLVENHRKQLCAGVRENLAQKGISQLIHIDRDNLFFLGASEYSGRLENTAVYQDKIGSYIKAVVEEYARKPYLEREAIFLKAHIQTIQEAIRHRRMIQVITKNQHMHYVKPYGIQADAEHLYHYLSGYLFNSADGSWSPGSFRLSSVTGCTILYQDGDLSPEQTAELKSAIQKKGVAFLSNVPDREGPQRVVVQFTKEGKRMYHQMLHLRPLYSAPPKGLVYEFLVTPRQAENYFFKFGHNVRILEPQSLADKFRRRYESAAKQYHCDGDH